MTTKKKNSRTLEELHAMILLYLAMVDGRYVWDVPRLSHVRMLTERAFLHAMRKAIQGYPPDFDRFAAVPYPQVAKDPAEFQWGERHDQMMRWWKKQFGKSMDPRWASRMHTKPRTKDALAPAISHALKVLQISEQEFKEQYNRLFSKPQGEVLMPELTRL